MMSERLSFSERVRGRPLRYMIAYVETVEAAHECWREVIRLRNMLPGNSLSPNPERFRRISIPGISFIGNRRCVRIMLRSLPEEVSPEHFTKIQGVTEVHEFTKDIKRPLVSQILSDGGFGYGHPWRFPPNVVVDAEKPLEKRHDGPITVSISGEEKYFVSDDTSNFQIKISVDGTVWVASSKDGHSRIDIYEGDMKKIRLDLIR